MSESEQCSPVRDKNWSELDSDGKIERMRKEVHRLQDRIAEANRIVRKLTRHQHGSSGLLMPLQDSGGGPYELARRRDGDDVYF